MSGIGIALPDLRPLVVSSSVASMPLPPPSDASHMWARSGSVWYRRMWSAIQVGSPAGAWMSLIGALLSATPCRVFLASLAAHDRPEYAERRWGLYSTRRRADDGRAGSCSRSS